MASERPLNELPFTDMYINLSDQGVVPRYRPDPTKSKESGALPVPPEFLKEANATAIQILEKEELEGTIQYHGLRLRYSKFMAAEEEQWCAVRAVPLDLPYLDDLNFSDEFLEIIKSWGRRKGLIIVGGRTGDGKTTTCVAAIREYLEQRGGFAFSVEDPIEYQMQGAISQNALCIQNEVKDDDDWAPAVKRAMRTRPDFIFIGEIRTAGGAEQLLKAATSGHLVITTTHGGSLTDTINSILQLAETRMNINTARNIIADTLVAGIYQRLSKSGPLVEAIIPDRHNPNDPVAKIIARGQMSDVERNKSQYAPIRRR